MRRLVLPAIAILSLLTCGFAQAQHRGGGYRGGYGGGYHGGYGYGGYHGGYGYGEHGYGGYWPGIGIGVGLGYGAGYVYPGYYGPSYYYPSTVYVSPQNVVVPTSYVEAPTTMNSSNGSTQQQQAAETAIVHVLVPSEGAQVWLGNTEMTGNGMERKFRSPSLESGKQYSYFVKARWTDGAGQTREGSQTVEVKQGANIVVDFRGHPLNPNQN